MENDISHTKKTTTEQVASTTLTEIDEAIHQIKIIYKLLLVSIMVAILIIPVHSLFLNETSLWWVMFFVWCACFAVGWVMCGLGAAGWVDRARKIMGLPPIHAGFLVYLITPVPFYFVAWAHLVRLKKYRIRKAGDEYTRQNQNSGK